MLLLFVLKFHGGTDKIIPDKRSSLRNFIFIFVKFGNRFYRFKLDVKIVLNTNEKVFFFSEKNMLGANFPWILSIKTAALKMLNLCTFKILLYLNNSLVCSNLRLLKMMLFTFFKFVLQVVLQRDATTVLSNCEYTSS